MVIFFKFACVSLFFVIEKMLIIFLYVGVIDGMQMTPKEKENKADLYNVFSSCS